MTTQAKVTKAKTKGQRKRDRQRISLANGETATAPRTQGQRKPTEDARKVALQARVRVYGINEDDAASVLCTDAVDRCIMDLAKDTRAVAQTWLALITSQHNYRTRILGLTGYPNGAAIAMVPDAMQTDTGHTIDIRSADEKDATAKRSWAAWQAAIKALPVPHLKWAIDNALSGGMDGQGGDVWRDGKPTARGRVLVMALTELSIGR